MGAKATTIVRFITESNRWLTIELVSGEVHRLTKPEPGPKPEPE